MRYRLKLIVWIARRCGITEGSRFPVWMKIVAYSIMPERIPVSRAISPVKYRIESDSLVIGEISFSCSSLITLARLSVGKKFELVSKDYGMLEIRLIQEDN